MRIKLSLVLEEIKDLKISKLIHVDSKLNRFEILNSKDETKLKNDVLYFTDLASLTALDDKKGKNFIILDPVRVLSGLDLDGGYNIIAINENITREALINRLNYIFFYYLLLENDLLSYISGNKDLVYILRRLKEKTSLNLSLNDQAGRLIVKNFFENKARIKSLSVRQARSIIGSFSLYESQLDNDLSLNRFYFVSSVLEAYIDKYFQERLKASKALASTILESLMTNRDLTKQDLENLKVLSWNKEDDYILIRLKNIRSQAQKEINRMIQNLYPKDAIFMRIQQGEIILANTKNIDGNIFTSEVQHLLSNEENYLALASGKFTGFDNIYEEFKTIRSMEENIKSGFYKLDEDMVVLFFKSKQIKKDFINKEIIKLYEYDKENNDELFETLFVYIANERSYVKTSEILNLHRNTIVYRIGKIKGVIDLDLENFKTRLDCLLSSIALDNSLLKY